MKLRPGVPVLLLLWLAAPVAAGAGSASDATPPPALTLDTADGTLSLSSLRGHVVLVDFWASWCEPCRKSFPWLNTLATRYAGKGFKVLAINLDKTRDPASLFLRDHPARFLVAFDPAGKSAEAFKVSAMPSSYLIGANGTILYSHSGIDPRAEEAIEARVVKACAP